MSRLNYLVRGPISFVGGPWRAIKPYSWACLHHACRWTSKDERNFTVLGRVYSGVPGHRNWQIGTAVWNLAGFLHCALESHWQRFGQFLRDLCNDFLNDFLSGNLNFLCENLRFSLENLGFSLQKILTIFSMIFLTILKISYYKVRVSTEGVQTRWLGWHFLNGL